MESSQRHEKHPALEERDFADGVLMAIEGLVAIADAEGLGAAEEVIKASREAMLNNAVYSEKFINTLHGAQLELLRVYLATAQTC